VKKAARNIGVFCIKAVLLSVFLGMCLASTRAFANGFLITGGQYGGPNDENLCLDVVGANFSNGARIQSYTCNGTPAQNWIINNSYHFPGVSISPAAAPGYCLDVPSWNFTTGQYLQLYQCTGGTNQNFFIPVGGNAIVADDGSNYNRYCLSIQSGDVGTPITLAPCDGSMKQEFWPYGFKVVFEALPLNARGVHQQCLTVNGNSLWTTSCGQTSTGFLNPSRSQIFTLDFNNHVISNLNNLCLDQGNFTGSLSLTPCNSGTLNSQSFFPGAVHTGYNYAPWVSGLFGYDHLCININGNFWQPYSYINMAWCSAGSPNQAWQTVIVSN
jgi:hypothetical protein